MVSLGIMTPDQLHAGMAPETVIEVVKAHLKAAEKSIEELKAQLTLMDEKLDRRDVEWSRIQEKTAISLGGQETWRAEVRGNVNMMKFILGGAITVFSVVGLWGFNQIAEAQKELARTVDDHAVLQNVKSHQEEQEIQLGIIKQHLLEDAASTARKR